LLNSIKGLTINNCLVLAFEPFAAVVHLAEINSVLEKIGEGP
jgi:hypothetical protein